MKENVPDPVIRVGFYGDEWKRSFRHEAKFAWRKFKRLLVSGEDKITSSRLPLSSGNLINNIEKETSEISPDLIQQEAEIWQRMLL